MDFSFQKCILSFQLSPSLHKSQYASSKCKNLERILCLSCNTAFPSWLGRNFNLFFLSSSSNFTKKDHLCAFSLKNTFSYSAEEGSREQRLTNFQAQACTLLFCVSDHYMLLYFLCS